MQKHRNTDTTPPKAFLRVATIASMLDISKGQVWNMTKNGTFPAARKLSPQITVWDAEEVQNWINQQLGKNPLQEAA